MAGAFIMSNEVFLLEKNHRGRFQKLPRTKYVRGQKDLHNELWDMDYLSFFELKAICRDYGYTTGDFLYYVHQAKSFNYELVLLKSNMDVLNIMTSQKGQKV